MQASLEQGQCGLGCVRPCSWGEEITTRQAAMVDVQQIRARLKLARETLEAVNPRSADDACTRRRIELARERCEDLIRELEALLDGQGR